jgi:hypothetical protein
MITVSTTVRLTTDQISLLLTNDGRVMSNTGNELLDYVLRLSKGCTSVAAAGIGGMWTGLRDVDLQASEMGEVVRAADSLLADIINVENGDEVEG